MKLFRRIDTTTGLFIDDVQFESNPYLTETVLQDFTDEEGVTTQNEVTQTVTTTVLVDVIDEEGVVTQVEQEQPVYDPQYIEDDVPQGFYWPKWNGTEWVEGGVAPEPTPAVPTDVERILAMEEALDFLLMGGM